LVNALKGSSAVNQTIPWFFYQCSQHILRSSPQTGRFPLVHGDFTDGNFMWDKDFNLTAAIDWTNTMSMPPQILGVIHEFYSDDSERVRESRVHFAAILAEEEIRLGFDDQVSSLLISPLAEILTIIKECDAQPAATLYHFPHLLELLPETIDVSTLDKLSPGFIDHAKYDSILYLKRNK